MSELTVEAALAELRQMAQAGDYPPYVTAGFRENGKICFVISHGRGQHAEGHTLNEAMDQVRKWRKEQP